MFSVSNVASMLCFQSCAIRKEWQPLHDLEPECVTAEGVGNDDECALKGEHEQGAEQDQPKMLLEHIAALDSLGLG